MAEAAVGRPLSPSHDLIPIVHKCYYGIHRYAVATIFVIREASESGTKYDSRATIHTAGSVDSLLPIA